MGPIGLILPRDSGGKRQRMSDKKSSGGNGAGSTDTQSKHPESGTSKSTAPANAGKPADKTPTDKASTKTTTSAKSGGGTSEATTKRQGEPASPAAGASRKSSGSGTSGGDTAKPGSGAKPGGPGRDNATNAKPAASRGTTPPAGGDNGTGRGGHNRGGARPIALIVAVAALIVAVLSLAAAAWVYVQGQSRAEATDSQIDTATKNIKSQVQQQLGSQVEKTGQQVSQLTTRVSKIDQRVSQHDQALQAIQDTLSRIRSQNRQLQKALGGNNETFIEQRVAALLETASQRLTIYRDPQGAIAALKTADDIIAQAGYPQLRPVREAIADELSQLKSLPNPDIEGLALTLSKLVDRVPQLPTETDVPSTYERGQSAQGSDNEQAGQTGAAGSNDDSGFAGIDWQGRWQQLTDRAGQALSSMISVRRANGTQNAPTLMAPDQAFFLVQNVQLSLRSARLALLDGNQSAYRASLSDATDSIRQFFDTDASATKAMLATIDELSEAELAWQAPDISDSFTRLRRIMNRDQSGGSATAPDAGNPGSGENAAAAAQGGA